MSRPPRLLSPLAVLLAILIGEIPASAATLTETRMVPLRTTGRTDSSSLTFNKFDRPNAVLESVEFRFSGHVELNVRLENLSNAPQTITTFINATLTLRRPDDGVLLNLSPSGEKSYTLRESDGISDFGGLSGVTDSSLVVNESRSMLIDQPSDFAQYMGPGTFSRVLRTDSNSGFRGGGSTLSSLSGMASAEVTVIYTFTEEDEPNPPDDLVVPEPSSFALLGIGGGLTLLCGHLRGRRRRNMS